jgi:Nuclear transport factor 2 (NTF2) domain
MATSAPTSNGTHHQNVVPSEVGWQFVPQYYTFVNKEPHRLHCFYNKTSTFIHGTEGEEIKPCYGQQVSIARSRLFLITLSLFAGSSL